MIHLQFGFGSDSLDRRFIRRRSFVMIGVHTNMEPAKGAKPPWLLLVGQHEVMHGASSVMHHHMSTVAINWRTISSKTSLLFCFSSPTSSLHTV
jgi:hypothetical protein